MFATVHNVYLAVEVTLTNGSLVLWLRIQAGCVKLAWLSCEGSTGFV